MGTWERKKLVNYWPTLVQEVVRHVDIVQRLLRLEKNILIFLYFMNNSIYKQHEFLVVDFPRKSSCNVLIELFLLYASWFHDYLIVFVDDQSRFKSIVLVNYNQLFESTRNFYILNIILILPRDQSNLDHSSIIISLFSFNFLFYCHLL